MKRIALITLLLVLLTACGGAGETAPSVGAPTDAGAVAPEAEPMPAAEEAPAPDTVDSRVVDRTQLTTAQNIQAQRERVVLKTATLQLVVERIDTAEAGVRQLAESHGGFVLSSQTHGQGEQRTATITIKVPADRFDQTISELSGLALEVESRSIEGQDVTDEYVDLQSRLRNLRAVEQRLLEFLGQAENVEDALKVNQQLTDIQGQIEQTQGRINFLEQSAALSTITVSMRGQAVVNVVPNTSWSPVATARTALRSLLAFGQSLANVLIVVAVWSPVWLLIMILAMWLWRRSRRTVVGPT